jgi:hypothetical protein
MAMRQDDGVYHAGDAGGATSAQEALEDAMRACAKALTILRAVAQGPRPCVTCDEPFTPAHFDGRYCSNACRSKANRRRRPRAEP